MANRFSKYGINYTLRRSQGALIGALEAQKLEGKAIYGRGFLLAEKAAAEKAVAEKAAAEKAGITITVWPLSESERAIIQELNEH